MKVLVITSSYDLTVDYLIEKFGKNVDFFRLNTDKLMDYEICVSSEVNFLSIKNKYKEIVSNEIQAVYYRKPVLPNLADYDSVFHKLMDKEMITLIEGIAESFDGRCLSKPSVLKRADNKILQLKLAHEVGFKMPRSFIANSNKNVSHFVKGQNNTIVKPLSVGKVNYDKSKIGIIQTNLVRENIAVKNLELSPSYFQEYIEKQYELRVTIIGQSIYAVRIDTDEKIDWRKDSKNIRYSKYNFSDDLAKKCFSLMRKLNLDFGAFDFIIGKNDETYFLEVNANGQWGWLEQELKLGISDDIIAYLKGEMLCCCG